MNTDCRALCAELVEKLDALNCSYNIPSQSALVERARAALAKPEPVAPTDEELPMPAAIRDMPEQQQRWYALGWRAALARYGTPAIQPVPVAPPMPVPGDAEGLAEVFWGRYDQPEPVAPTESDVTELFYRHMGEGSQIGFENAIAEALARWGTPAIEPVPVSERPWEREGWCDAEGRCWWWHPDHKEDDFDAGWILLNPKWADGRHDFDRSLIYTHWLPHHALPTPEATNQEGSDRG
jgi:hypothetical protein